MRELLRALWWPQTSSDASAAHSADARVRPTSCWDQPAATRLTSSAFALAQLRGPSRAAGSVEGAGDTDKGQGAGQAGSVEADDESYSDGLERYVRAACVSLSRSESSHENAHLRLLRIAWQVMLYSQRLRR